MNQNELIDISEVMLCIAEHGWNEQLNFLFGEEMRENGIDTSQPETIITQLIELVDVDIDTEGYGVALGVIILPAIVALIAKQSTEENKNFLNGDKFTITDESGFNIAIQKKKFPNVKKTDLLDQLSNAARLFDLMAKNKEDVTDVLSGFVKLYGGKLHEDGELELPPDYDAKKATGEVLDYTAKDMQDIFDAFKPVLKKINVYDSKSFKRTAAKWSAKKNNKLSGKEAKSFSKAMRFVIRNPIEHAMRTLKVAFHAHKPTFEENKGN